MRKNRAFFSLLLALCGIAAFFCFPTGNVAGHATASAKADAGNLAAKHSVFSRILGDRLAVVRGTMARGSSLRGGLREELSRRGGNRVSRRTIVRNVWAVIADYRLTISQRRLVAPTIFIPSLFSYTFSAVFGRAPPPFSL